MNWLSREFEDMSGTDIIKLIVSIAACQGAGGIGAIFTTPAITTWYAKLKKPSFTPPNSVFGPVWITLYLMMGISLYIIWEKGTRKKASRSALKIFAVQLVLNALWSMLFFGLKSPLLAFIGIVFLWTAILLTIRYFHKISRTAAYLLIPYILWVSFAAVLNFSIYYLN